MSPKDLPLVSVVTPVYNGEPFIARCIESVLQQTYTNFEYLIVNNCSKDRTLEIAQRYAAQDSRIRVHDADSFVRVIANHNRAFDLIAPGSAYCKVVSADDGIFPECLAQMVSLAEANPAVAMVGTYMLAGKQVVNSGLAFEQTVVNGREICRATLLGGPYVFGAPSSLLYRADLLRAGRPFYPRENPHSDTTACYQSLEQRDFGFVHQVLAWAQIHAETQTSRSLKYGTIHRALISDLVQFGPVYLTPTELQGRLAFLVETYYRWLVGALLDNRGDPEFWSMQKAELEAIGLELSYGRLCKAMLRNGIGGLVTPRHTWRQLMALARRDPKQIRAQFY